MVLYYHEKELTRSFVVTGAKLMELGLHLFSIPLLSRFGPLELFIVQNIKKWLFWELSNLNENVLVETNDNFA